MDILGSSLMLEGFLLGVKSLSLVDGHHDHGFLKT